MTKDEAITAYISDYSLAGTIDPEATAEGNYRGQYGSREAYARQLAYEQDEARLFAIPGYITIDWEQTARNMEAEDRFAYYPSGHVFEVAS